MTHSALWLPVGSRKKGIVEASKNESQCWMVHWTIPLTLALTNINLSIFWIVRFLSCSKYCGSKFYIISANPSGAPLGFIPLQTPKFLLTCVEHVRVHGLHDHLVLVGSSSSMKLWSKSWAMVSNLLIWISAHAEILFCASCVLVL